MGTAYAGRLTYGIKVRLPAVRLAFMKVRMGGCLGIPDPPRLMTSDGMHHHDRTRSVVDACHRTQYYE